MGTFTPNYNLLKPDGADLVDEDPQLNDNWDIVDTQIKNRSNEIVALQAADVSLDARLDVVESFDKTRTAYKPSTEFRDSSSTPSNDADLTLSVVNGKKYVLHGALFVMGSDNGSDFKWKLNHPGGTSRAGGIGLGSNATQTANAGVVTNQVLVQPDTFIHAAINVDPSIISIEGYFAPTADGSITLQWSQAVSSGAPISLLSGSYFSLTEV